MRSLMKQRALELRREMTPFEKWLWRRLRRLELEGVHFKRQVVLGPYIVDFAALKQRLLIEVDGEIHDTQIEQDECRTRYLQEQGYRVLRIPNSDIARDLERVLGQIIQALRPNTPPCPFAQQEFPPPVIGGGWREAPGEGAVKGRCERALRMLRDNADGAPRRTRAPRAGHPTSRAITPPSPGTASSTCPLALPRSLS